MFADIFVKHAESIVSRLWNGGEPGYEAGTEFVANAGMIGYKK